MVRPKTETLPKSRVQRNHKNSLKNKKNTSVKKVIITKADQETEIDVQDTDGLGGQGGVPTSKPVSNLLTLMVQW